MAKKDLTNLRDAILDSSLISATFSKELYDTQIIFCNNYIQVYKTNNKKIRNKNINKKNSILKIDTDDLIIVNDTLKNNDLKVIAPKNINRSKLKCQRLAKCNSNDWQTFITLTFKENITDIDFANKQLHKFFSSVRRFFKDFKYLCVPEFMKNGRVHYHLLTNIPANSDIIPKRKPLKLWNKDLKKYKRIDYYDIKYWNYGFSSAEIVEGDIKKIVGYISKYMTKDIDNRLFFKNRYLYSQNLFKPQTSYLNLSNPIHKKFYENLINKKECIYSNIYQNRYNNDLITFKEFL